MKKQQELYLPILLALLMVGQLLLPGVVSAATKMPAFALEDVRDGKIFDSRTLGGKVLLVTFFATWCPPCVEEVPVLVKLQKDMADAGFSVVGISVDQQGPAMVGRFVEKNAINYPVVLAGKKTTNDFGGIYGIPVAFLINKGGNVVKKYTGYINQSVLENDIRSLLK